MVKRDKLGRFVSTKKTTKTQKKAVAKKTAAKKTTAKKTAAKTCKSCGCKKAKKA